jgi:hemerythrin-like domain-containing protein
MTTPGNYNTEVGDMFAVHHALLGALDQGADLISAAGADPVRVDVVGSFYENVLEFLHVHHQGEDELIYPVLEERCPDELDKLVRIDDQHKLLYAPMDAAWAAIAAWRATPSLEGGRAVIDAIATVDETLRPHLGEEEVNVLPLATKWISQDEWAELPGHAMAIYRADKPWLALGLVRENLTLEQRDAMLAGMPPELQEIWTNQWEPAFVEFMAEVRG